MVLPGLAIHDDGFAFGKLVAVATEFKVIGHLL